MRCAKGLRECIFPGFLIFTPEKPQAADSKQLNEFDFDSEESDIEESYQSAEADSWYPTEPLDSLEPYDEKLLQLSSTDATRCVSPDFDDRSETVFDQETSFVVARCSPPRPPRPAQHVLHRFHYTNENPFIPRCPRSGAQHKIQSFLSFHQQEVSQGYYFRMDDPRGFCTKGLSSLSHESPTLQYAMASFASLVYSVCKNRETRQLAFVYYAQAIRQLQGLLCSKPINCDNDYLLILAIVLQLASVEVSPLSMGLMLAFPWRYSQMFSSCARCGADSATIF